MHRIVGHSDTSPPQQHERGRGERTNIRTVGEPAHPDHETERQRQLLVTFSAQNPQVGGQAPLEHDETELDGKQDDITHIEAVPDAEEGERHHVRSHLVAEEREPAEHIMAGPAACVDVKPFQHVLEERTDENGSVLEVANTVPLRLPVLLPIEGETGEDADALRQQPYARVLTEVDVIRQHHDRATCEKPKLPELWRDQEVALELRVVAGEHVGGAHTGEDAFEGGEESGVSVGGVRDERVLGELDVIVEGEERSSKVGTVEVGETHDLQKRRCTRVRCICLVGSQLLLCKSSIVTIPCKTDEFEISDIVGSSI